LTGEISINAVNADISSVFGQFDVNVKKIEKDFDVKIVNRGDVIKILGENAASAAKVINCLFKDTEKNIEITEQLLNYTIEAVKESRTGESGSFSDEVICLTVNGRPVRAKTLGQKKYTDAIKNNTVVFGIGPAGTGKTFLAMALAITAFKNGEVSRIILTRPAIEAGEKLGFLPGDLQQKIDPYLRPLYDALYEIMGAESYLRNTEKGLIEVAPLAYMRGRTLDNAFIVLDEAQNTTPEQMKMFLTRIGFGSKAVITGDITQIDLAQGKKSGLIESINILENIDQIAVMRLTNKDVVRHPLVAKIIEAYEKYDAKKNHTHPASEQNRTFRKRK